MNIMFMQSQNEDAVVDLMMLSVRRGLFNSVIRRRQETIRAVILLLITGSNLAGSGVSADTRGSEVCVLGRLGVKSCIFSDS